MVQAHFGSLFLPFILLHCKSSFPRLSYSIARLLSLVHLTPLQDFFLLSILLYCKTSLSHFFITFTMPEKRKPLPSEAPRRDNKSRNRRNDQQAKPVPLASSTSKSPHPTPEAGSSNVQKNEAKFKEHNHDVAKPSNEPLFTTPSEIPQTPTNAKVTKRADEYLRSSPDKRLLEIDKAIYNFVIHCLNSQPSWNILSEETQAKLTNWAPKAKQYIEGDLLLRGALYLAWVWRVLYEHLFSAECTDKWSGEHWSNYGKLRSELGGNISQTLPSLTIAY